MDESCDFQVGERVILMPRNGVRFDPRQLGKGGTVKAFELRAGAVQVGVEPDDQPGFVAWADARDLQRPRPRYAFQGFCEACGGLREHKRGCPPDSPRRPENALRTAWEKAMGEIVAPSIRRWKP